MEVRSDRKNESQFLPNYGRVDTAVWMHYLYANTTAGEKGRRQLHEQYWTSPGGNTPQGTNYMATYLPSRKLSKLDEPDMQDTAREVVTSS